MTRLALYISFLIFPAFGSGQLSFDPDTVQFIKITGPEFADVIKNKMLIDRRGLLWVATEIGLFAYDGYDWQVGLSQHNDRLNTIDQWLESVQEDSTGMIWFGSTVSGLHRVDPNSGEIEAYPVGNFSSVPLHSILMQELLLVDDQLVVQTPRGFLRFNPYTESYVDVHIPFHGRGEGTMYGLPAQLRSMRYIIICLINTIPTLYGLAPRQVR